MRRFLFLAAVIMLRFTPVLGADIELDGFDGFDEPDGEYAFSMPDKTAELPIVMYHLVTTTGKYIGRYGITPAELERDFKYLADNGYETVTVADLLAFVQRGRPLPEKPVMLTFDDGNSSDYLYLFPLLKQYKMKAVLSVLGKASDECTQEAEKYPQGKFPNLTWPQIKEMHESGLAEIQNHSYNLHGANGSGKRGGESPDEYRARFTNDLGKLQRHCKEALHREPSAFTYPLGVMSAGSDDALKAMGFKASFSCTEGMNVLKTNDPECLFRLKRDIRPTGRGIAQVLERIK